MESLRIKSIIKHAAAAALLVWLILVYIFYFKKIPSLFGYFTFFLKQYGYFSIWHPYALKAAYALVVAFWIACVTFKCGAQLLRQLLPRSKVSNLEWAVFSAALGIGIISLVTFTLGVLRLWYVAIFWSTLLLATFWFLWRDGFRLDLHKTFLVIAPPKEWWFVPVLVLLVLAGLVFLLGDLSPEVFYDSLHYHLAVPNLYLLNHRVYGEPDFAYSSFVMAVEMFWGFALTVGNEVTVKLLHGAAAILLLFTFIAIEQAYLARGSGFLGALFFLSMPLVGLNSITAGIDVVLTSLQVVAVFALARALSNDHEEDIGKKWMRLAAILTGLAASCKYTALPAIPLACLLIIWIRRIHHSQPWSTIVKQVAGFAVCAILVVSPYFVRNFVFHQNPIYPFAGTFWGHPRISPENWRNSTGETLPRDLREEFSSVRSAVRFIFHPWFMSMPAPGQFAETTIGPVLLGLLPILLLARPPGVGYRVLALHSLGNWLIWLLTTSYIRFNMPALALVLLLLADGLVRFRGGWITRQALLTLCILGVVWNLYFTFTVFTLTEGWRVVGGMISEHDYLAEAHSTYPTPDYEALDWMNNNLPAGSKVMIAGDSRSYYTRIPVVPSSVFDPQPIIQTARAAKDGRDMARLLREHGVTHLFVNFGEAVRTESYGLFPWDKKSWNVLQDFWQTYVRLIWVSQHPPNPNPKALLVYQIRSDLGAHDATLEPPPNPFERWKPR